MSIEVFKNWWGSISDGFKADLYFNVFWIFENLGKYKVPDLVLPFGDNKSRFYEQVVENHKTRKKI